MSPLSTGPALEELLDFIEAQAFGEAPFVDVIEKVPGLSDGDAYCIQIALMKRRAAGGDPIVGYKAASTSRQRTAGQRDPVFGTLLRSGMIRTDEPIALVPGTRTTVEAEIAVLLKHDLAGPGAGLGEVAAAVEGYFPAFEIGRRRTEALKRSNQMALAAHKSEGGVVLGAPLSAPHGIDLRLEGMVISVDGDVRGSATAVEVLSDPLNSVAFLANELAKYGERLRAGMILMTGSIIPLIEIVPGDREVRAEFTRLGSVSAHFTS